MSPSPTDPDLKRSGFRGRLKWPADKNATTAPPAQQEATPKKRAPYRPKHAASDFSRLAAPPVPRRLSSSQPNNDAAQMTPPSRASAEDEGRSNSLPSEANQF